MVWFTGIRVTAVGASHIKIQKFNQSDFVLQQFNFVLQKFNLILFF